jgi:SAM-dependent methyltransferase
MKFHEGEQVTLYHGNCIEVMKNLPENSVDSIVTDPPYELGFMGKSWDSSGVAFNVEVWKEALRVLKPGGHLIAFSGSRTYHRMAVAIEDAGFEIRDQIMWLYGSGFPKSMNIGKTLSDWQGWGTALKPAHEPMVLARKPLIGTVAANVLEYGTGGLNIDGTRVGTEGGTRK